MGSKVSLAWMWAQNILYDEYANKCSSWGFFSVREKIQSLKFSWYTAHGRQLLVNINLKKNAEGEYMLVILCVWCY